MHKLFTCFTDKMDYLFKDVVASLGQLPLEQRSFLFDGEDDVDMEWVLGMAGYITMEYIKYSFDYADPEYSLRYFRKGENDTDDERMLQSRIMKYVLKYKKREIDLSGVELPPEHKFADVSMGDIDKKLKGHRLTEMNYFEHQNIHDLELIKSVVENRIGYAKKVSNARFRDIFSEYDDFIEDMIQKSKDSDPDMVFYSIAFFTLEWHYPVELFYHIACIMEENGIQEPDRSDLVLLCGNVEIESIYSGRVSTHSRMVRERLSFADALFDKAASLPVKEELRSLIKEFIALGARYKESILCNDGTRYIDWFRNESCVPDWASFFRYYDIFSIWERKEWTPKRIQIMRNLFNLTTLEKI